MATRLLERQVRLLEYLTSGGAIFGGDDDVFGDPVLCGIDRGLLRLEASFSHDKRMEKISAVFPRTLHLLGSDQPALIREFTEACPPVDISRVENARQFYEFLRARWRRQLPRPLYLPDVAACEFAFAQAHAGVRAGTAEPTTGSRWQRGAVRRRPGVILLNCAHNIRPIFEGGAEKVAADEIAVVEGATPVAIVIPPGASHPSVCELLPAAFDLLAVLDGWTDRSALRAIPQVADLIDALAEHGLVEVSR